MIFFSIERLKDRIMQILEVGAKKAQGIAQKTMTEVRKVVFGSWATS